MTWRRAARLTSIVAVFLTLLALSFAFTAYTLHESNKGDSTLIDANCARIAAIRRFQDAYQKALELRDPALARVRDPLLARLRADFKEIGGC